MHNKRGGGQDIIPKRHMMVCQAKAGFLACRFERARVVEGPVRLSKCGQVKSSFAKARKDNMSVSGPNAF
jgi:hypothetical protein